MNQFLYLFLFNLIIVRAAGSGHGSPDCQRDNTSPPPSFTSRDSQTLEVRFNRMPVQTTRTSLYSIIFVGMIVYVHYTTITELWE